MQERVRGWVLRSYLYHLSSRDLYDNSNDYISTRRIHFADKPSVGGCWVWDYDPDSGLHAGCVLEPGFEWSCEREFVCFGCDEDVFFSFSAGFDDESSEQVLGFCGGKELDFSCCSCRGNHEIDADFNYRVFDFSSSSVEVVYDS